MKVIEWFTRFTCVVFFSVLIVGSMLKVPWTWNLWKDFIILFTYEKGLSGHLLTYMMIGLVGLTGLYRFGAVKALVYDWFFVSIHEIVWYGWVFLILYEQVFFSSNDFLWKIRLVNPTLYLVGIAVYCFFSGIRSRMLSLTVAVYVLLESSLASYVLVGRIDYKAFPYVLVDEVLWIFLAVGFIFSARRVRA